MRQWKVAFSTPPPRLAVMFKETQIAELRRDQGKYVFRYLPEFDQTGLAPIPSFPDKTKVYRSPELWQFFRERIPDLRRPEIRAWLEQHSMLQADELQLLELLGARSVTDPFEIRRAA